MNKECFIICPIGKEETEIRKRSDKVYNHLLKPVCESLGYDLIRSDKIASANKIDIEILNYLDSSELAIADLTGLNPNVFYELGYREAKGLPCVQIALEGTELPFDRSTFRTQFYSITDFDKAEEFKTNLKEVIKHIDGSDAIDEMTSNKFKSKEQSFQNFDSKEICKAQEIGIEKKDGLAVFFNSCCGKIYINRKYLIENYIGKLRDYESRKCSRLVGWNICIIANNPFHINVYFDEENGDYKCVVPYLEEKRINYSNQISAKIAKNGVLNITFNFISSPMDIYDLDKIIVKPIYELR